MNLYIFLIFRQKYPSSITVVESKLKMKHEKFPAVKINPIHCGNLGEITQLHNTSF